MIDLSTEIRVRAHATSKSFFGGSGSNTNSPKVRQRRKKKVADNRLASSEYHESQTLVRDNEGKETPPKLALNKEDQEAVIMDNSPRKNGGFSDAM